MPGYKFLIENEANLVSISSHMQTLQKIGVPYTNEMIQNAVSDAIVQASVDKENKGLLTRYGQKITMRDFDGNPNKVSEMDALVAYLQVLGTMVDFANFQPLTIKEYENIKSKIDKK
jgi:cytochrome c oxidase cbb3-type subunit 2